MFATTEIPLWSGETVLIEQSWLTTTVGCTAQTPGLTLGTSTTGCHLESIAYVDRMFGTLAFLYVTSRPACSIR